MSIEISGVALSYLWLASIAICFAVLFVISLYLLWGEDNAIKNSFDIALDITATKNTPILTIWIFLAICNGAIKIT
jgi:hypothetical protein